MSVFGSTALTVARKLDPNWPKCLDCGEPITKGDLKRRCGKAGYCYSCFDYRQHGPHSAYEPTTRPAIHWPQGCEWDELPENLDPLEPIA